MTRQGMGIFEKYGQSKVNVSNDKFVSQDWWSKLRILAEAMIFSATIFLSGTELFIDPPEIPEMPRWSRFQVKVAFTAERVLGAFFSILFFLAIGAAVVK
jgi:hypothetical protein